MADFTVTVSNSVNLFGPAPSNKWDAWAWNAFNWGEGTAGLAVDFHKVFAETITPTDAVTVVSDFVVSLANSLAPTADMGSERLTDAAGYAYVYPSDTTEAENRDFPNWSSGTAGAPTWATATAGNTSWS